MCTSSTEFRFSQTAIFRSQLDYIILPVCLTGAVNAGIECKHIGTRLYSRYGIAAPRAWRPARATTGAAPPAARGGRPRREARWVDDPVVRVELDAEQLAADLAESASGDVG